MTTLAGYAAFCHLPGTLDCFWALANETRSLE
ncbi:hypothetical protein BMF94_0648 [Rhodotorula taiwanensis]|uniref:Uncharacterized protein n=1 Tax=Rhodotorula taiwanensis TaxID=741276 RepID=A0A2S5BI52_9BASI|nr:hypothetical protein BMF94_0648 [Rhodotorula taiwanensis]